MKCDKCGICCKLFKLAPIPKEYLILDDGTGKCKYLKNNLCSIYENRPKLCDSNFVYEKYYSEFYSKKEYDEFMEKQCKLLKDKFGDVFNAKGLC